MIDYLCGLVSIRSITGKEKTAQDNIAAKLSSIGMTIDQFDIDLDKTF